MNNVRILSIDGGGIRSIIPLKVLEYSGSNCMEYKHRGLERGQNCTASKQEPLYIERQTDKQIHELFDVIGGTSTGGIIALGLNSEIPGT
jgi:patatin-like phospholipase/acyl hydrolase